MTPRDESESTTHDWRVALNIRVHGLSRGDTVRSETIIDDSGVAPALPDMIICSPAALGGRNEVRPVRGLPVDRRVKWSLAPFSGSSTVADAYCPKVQLMGTSRPDASYG